MNSIQNLMLSISFGTSIGIQMACWAFLIGNLIKWLQRKVKARREKRKFDFTKHKRKK